MFAVGNIDCEGVEAEGIKLLPDVMGSCAEARLKVDELERVGEGVTGPNSRRRELRPISGSDASKLIAIRYYISRRIPSPTLPIEGPKDIGRK